jgi:uncharacterized protein DUF6615
MNGEDDNRKILCDLARSAFEVVGHLLARDQFLARELRSSTTGSRQIYREECLTVEMAATLLEQFPDHVEITLFTPPEETRTGADWYWRFERGDRAIHARVQAKRVQREQLGDPDERGHIDIDVLQLNRLLQATAEATTLPGLEAWLATYARFNATPPCGKQNLQSCPQHSHQEACASVTPSLWIAQANEIVKLSDGAVTVSTIIRHSLRLDCLLPCIDGSERDPSPAIKGFALQGGLKTYQECIATIESDEQLRKEFEGAIRITT